MLHLIPQRNEMERSVKLAQRYHAAFEYNDFFIPSVLDDPEEIEKIVSSYLALDRDRSHDTLHGVFLDITIHSDDPKIREASDFRIRQSMDIAARLGVRAVIFHTNIVPNFFGEAYVGNWVERNRVYWKQILSSYPKLEVYLENMFDIQSEPLKRLAEEMKDEPHFGVCFDYAHASVFGDNLSEWTEGLLPYIRHMHINDNDLKVDCHWPVGDGSVDWNRFTAFARQLPDDLSVLIEVSTLDAFEKSVLTMQERNIYPFDRKEPCHAGI